MSNSSKIQLDRLPPLPENKSALVTGDVSLLHQPKYSVPQAAKLMGISETNLRAIIRAGELPVVRALKAKVQILEMDLEVFLQRRHGTIREEKVKSSRMPSLPDFVATSKYLKRKVS